MPKYHGGRDNELATIEVPAASYNAAENGAGVDMHENGGWDGVVFEAALGAFTGAAVFNMTVEEADLANFSGATAITGAAIAEQTSDDPEVVVAIDVFRPQKRYIRVVATPSENNVALAVVARRYRAQGRTPVDLPNGSQYVTVQPSS